MWYKTKEGIEVFNTKNRGFFYQLTNEYPKAGDYCLVSLEHDPVHITKVKSFNEKEYYCLNGNSRYGMNVWLRKNGEIGFYGVGKIVWSDNPELAITQKRDQLQQFKYWSSKHSDVKLGDF